MTIKLKAVLPTSSMKDGKNSMAMLAIKSLKQMSKRYWNALKIMPPGAELMK
jgi:hypothetical protein